MLEEETNREKDIVGGYKEKLGNLNQHIRLRQWEISDKLRKCPKSEAKSLQPYILVKEKNFKHLQAEQDFLTHCYDLTENPRCGGNQSYYRGTSNQNLGYACNPNGFDHSKTNESAQEIDRQPLPDYSNSNNRNI